MRIGEYSLTKEGTHGGIRSYHSVLTPQARPYNAHHHTECEISVFLSGAGRYTVKDVAYDFSAGDVFLFGSNEEHSITEITADIDLLNIQFEPFLLWETADTMEILSLFGARNACFQNRFGDEGGVIRAHLLALEAELCGDAPCRALGAKYHLFMALTAIIRGYDCIERGRAVTASEGVTQSLRLVIDHIQKNLDKRLTLAQLAGVACLSPTYFSSVFKKFNGISLWEYIAIKRVERAVELLKSERLTKIEIAEICGFQSPSHFYKTFAAVTGKTPSDYVK